MPSENTQTHQNENERLELDSSYLSQIQDIIQSGKGELTDDQLARIKHIEDQRQILNSGVLGVVNKVEQKKGLLSFVFLKIPMRVASVESLGQNQKMINSTFKSMMAPICPLCAEGILMYNKGLAVNPNKETVWFCSIANCEFQVKAKPSIAELNRVLPSKIKQSLAIDKMMNISDEERIELIQSHYQRSTMFRYMAYMILVGIIVQIILGYYLNAFYWIFFDASMYLLALKWGYRAWQIKTGMVFQPKSLFIPWVMNAPSWFSVDWVDDEHAPKI